MKPHIINNATYKETDILQSQREIVFVQGHLQCRREKEVLTDVLGVPWQDGLFQLSSLHTKVSGHLYYLLTTHFNLDFYVIYLAADIGRRADW